MTLQEQIRSNRMRTIFVLLAFVALVAALALVVGTFYDPGLMGIVGIVGIVYGVVSWFGAGKMVARATGARPVSRHDAPELYRSVENAAIAAGLDRTPAVYIIDDPAPNAFAAGRTPETSYVAATTGLLELMDRRELDGVMAHEIAHVRNQDVRLMTITAVLVGIIALVTDMLMRATLWGGAGRSRGGNGGMGAIGLVVAVIALILAPLVAAMLQMALSRRREYLADASAAEITGDAEGLARALAKLANDHTPLRNVNHATAHFYIESPMRDHAGLRSSLGGMFDTHPPIEERIRRLHEMGGLVMPSALGQEPR